MKGSKGLTRCLSWKPAQKATAQYSYFSCISCMKCAGSSYLTNFGVLEANSKRIESSHECFEQSRPRIASGRVRKAWFVLARLGGVGSPVSGFDFHPLHSHSANLLSLWGIVDGLRGKSPFECHLTVSVHTLTNTMLDLCLFLRKRRLNTSFNPLGL